MKLDSVDIKFDRLYTAQLTKHPHDICCHQKELTMNLELLLICRLMNSKSSIKFKVSVIETPAPLKFFSVIC